MSKTAYGINENVLFGGPQIYRYFASLAASQVSI